MVVLTGMNTSPTGLVAEQAVDKELSVFVDERAFDVGTLELLICSNEGLASAINQNFGALITRWIVD